MTAAANISETATRLAKSIMALPPLPATAQEILTCFGDEFIDAAKVAAVVEGDPGISAKLLGLANSAYFGLVEPVKDIGEAIARVLGVDTVRSLVLAMAIQNSFKCKECPDFDVERFWMMSLMAAECCKKIAAADEAADTTTRGMAYSAGLCHNLGLMALIHIEPARTCKVLQTHREQGLSNSLAGLFRLEFKTDHRIMTAELARIWSLPDSIVAAYQHRACPDSTCDERLGLIVAAGIAAVENTEVDEDQRCSLAPWSEALGISIDDIQGMARLSERQKDRVRSLASNMTC